MAAHDKEKAAATDPEVENENPTSTLVRGTGLTSMATVNDKEPGTILYASPSNPGEVPLNFKVESKMGASEVELCIQEFGIFDSMCCKEARPVETVSQAEAVGWVYTQATSKRG